MQQDTPRLKARELETGDNTRSSRRNVPCRNHPTHRITGSLVRDTRSSVRILARIAERSW